MKVVGGGYKGVYVNVRESYPDSQSSWMVKYEGVLGSPAPTVYAICVS